MNIEYESRKDLPCKELYELFFSVGWKNWYRGVEMLVPIQNGSPGSDYRSVQHIIKVFK